MDSSGDAEKLLIESICNATINEDDIKNIQAGHGTWEIEHFSIFLNRLNLGEMIPFGEVYLNALKIKDEEQQRKAETYEVGSDLQKAAALVAEFAKSNITITLEDALEKIMAWKITREANASMSISAIAAAIFKSMKGGK